MVGPVAKVMVRSCGLALLLAFVSWPLVALTLGAVPLYEYRGGHTQVVPVSPLGLWSAAASAVFPAALIAGSLGGVLVRRYWLGGAIITFVLALIVAIETVLVLPVLLGQELGVACSSGSPFASPPCEPIFTTTQFGNQWLGLFYLPFAPLAEPGPVLILAAGIAIWSGVLRREQWMHWHGALDPPSGSESRSQ